MYLIEQLDLVIEVETAVLHRHVARVDPVGHIDIVVGQDSGDGAAQQRREMPGKRRDDQQLRLFGRLRLAEMHEPAERVDRDGFLGHLGLDAADRYAVDAEIGPLVPDAAIREHVECRGGAAQKRRTPEPAGVEQAVRGLGEQAKWSQDVAMCVIRVVQHKSSSALASSAAAAPVGRPTYSWITVIERQ